MKILLTAINAKYIHSNLAVYDLKAFAEKYMDAARKEKVEITYCEFTINHPVDRILEQIYREKPDVLGFSCYIWNITYVEILIKELKKLLPSTDIWLGGPEVSFDAYERLQKFPQIKGVLCGEGERIFTNLCNYYGASYRNEEELAQINGITYRNSIGDIIENVPETAIHLSDVPFPYGDNLNEELAHRIIYYESSRGCPFSCSYCLSSVDKILRFRDLELVKQELQFFIDRKVPQVKFVDRTFNCNKSHAMAVWQYILEHDNGITNFHFEIGADLLDEEELALLGQMRPGLVQLEIGVQSTNELTIHEVSRKMNLEDLYHAVTKLRKFQNINLHLDLIAGLPYEDLKSFQKSFCDIYRLYPDQLQLGFLKVLKGSAIRDKTEEYGILYKSYAPYEMMSTGWLTFADVLLLKGVEEMVEIYYNSGQFTHTLHYILPYFEDSFTMYRKLAHYYETHFDANKKHARMDRYYILREFLAQYLSEEELLTADEIMVFDIYLRENMKTRPAFAADVKKYKQQFHTISVSCKLNHDEHVELLSKKAWEILGQQGVTAKETAYTADEEVLQDKILVYFDYRQRNPLNHNAAVHQVTVQ